MILYVTIARRLRLWTAKVRLRRRPQAQDAAGRPGHVAARLRHGYLLHGVHFVLIKTVLECF